MPRQGATMVPCGYKADCACAPWRLFLQSNEGIQSAILRSSIRRVGMPNSAHARGLRLLVQVRQRASRAMQSQLKQPNLEQPSPALLCTCCAFGLHVICVWRSIRHTAPEWRRPRLATSSVGVYVAHGRVRKAALLSGRQTSALASALPSLEGTNIFPVSATEVKGCLMV